MDPPPPYPGTKGGEAFQGQQPYTTQPPAGAYPTQPPAGAYPTQPPPGAYPTQPPAGAYPAQPPAYPPPPSAGYVPPPTQTQTTVVVQQPVAVGFNNFRENPVQCTCPHCHSQVLTSTEYETGTVTWVVAAILCFVGCGWGCCLIPFCVDSCKDVIHSCPNCKQIIHRHTRM